MQLGSRRAVVLVTIAAILAGCSNDSRTERVSWDPASLRALNTARIDFRVLADGAPPAEFGPGPSKLSTNPAGDRSVTLRVEKGKLTNHPMSAVRTAGYYSTADMAGPIAVIGAKWTFTRRGGSVGAMAILVSRDVLNPPSPMHLVVTPVDWSLGVWPPPGVEPNELTVINRGTFGSPLPDDGTTQLRVEVTIDDSSVLIQLPNGEQRQITDDRIAQWSGPFATFEAYADDGATGTQVAFAEIWAASRTPET